MGTGKYKRIKHKASGIVFVFKYDDKDPELLHIFARHLMTERDALRIWFEGTTKWNKECDRHETRTSTEEVTWLWLEQNKAVMIISCYRL